MGRSSSGYANEASGPRHRRRVATRRGRGAASYKPGAHRDRGLRGDDGADAVTSELESFRVVNQLGAPGGRSPRVSEISNRSAWSSGWEDSGLAAQHSVRSHKAIIEDEDGHSRPGSPPMTMPEVYEMDDNHHKICKRLEDLSSARIENLERFQSRALLVMCGVFAPLAVLSAGTIGLASPPLVTMIVIFTTIGDLDLDRFCLSRPWLVGLLLVVAIGLSAWIFSTISSSALWPLVVCLVYGTVHFVVALQRYVRGKALHVVPPVPGWAGLAIIGFIFATSGWAVDELTVDPVRYPVAAVFVLATVVSLYETGDPDQHADPTMLLIIVLYNYVFACGVSYIYTAVDLVDDCGGAGNTTKQGERDNQLNFCFEKQDGDTTKRYAVIGFGAAYVLLVPTVYIFRRKIRGWLSKILRRHNRDKHGLALGALFSVSTGYNVEYTKVGAELYFKSVTFDQIKDFLLSHRANHRASAPKRPVAGGDWAAASTGVGHGQAYDVSASARLHRVDYFVVMYQSGVATVNVPVLEVVRANFISKFGREPTFWLSEFCIDPRDLWERQTMYTPIFAGGCKRGLVVVSAELFKSLDSMVALYLTLAMQEDLSKIELVSATPSVSRMSSLDDNAVARTIRDSLDGFDVRRCTSDDPDRERFLREAIDRAGGTSVFNKEVVDGVLAILNTRASGETFSLTPALETLNDIVPGMNATSAIQPAELDRGRITVLNNLGSGAFGVVKKALYEPPDRAVPEHQVALKLLHEGPTEAEELEFAREAIVTAQFDHPNVIKLVGVVTVGTPTLMVLQYCAQGSLKDVLLQMQFSPGARDPGIIKLLVSHCAEIASGMAYLASRKFVHRDLACRNVLVDAAGKTKIADFGLTRDVQGESIYLGSNKEALPMRWAAEEVIRNYTYSEMSDVWSFGVTCLEIFDLGELPYGDWNNGEVAERVMGGYRLPRPRRCPGHFYVDVVFKCFDVDPDQRMTFKEISLYLSSINGDAHFRPSPSLVRRDNTTGGGGGGGGGMVFEYDGNSGGNSGNSGGNSGNSGGNSGNSGGNSGNSGGNSGGTQWSDDTGTGLGHAATGTGRGRRTLEPPGDATILDLSRSYSVRGSVTAGASEAGAAGGMGGRGDVATLRDVALSAYGKVSTTGSTLDAIQRDEAGALLRQQHALDAHADAVDIGIRVSSEGSYAVPEHDERGVGEPIAHYSAAPDTRYQMMELQPTIELSGQQPPSTGVTHRPSTGLNTSSSPAAVGGTAGGTAGGTVSAASDTATLHNPALGRPPVASPRASSSSHVVNRAASSAGYVVLEGGTLLHAGAGQAGPSQTEVTEANRVAEKAAEDAEITARLAEADGTAVTRQVTRFNSEDLEDWPLAALRLPPPALPPRSELGYVSRDRADRPMSMMVQRSSSALDASILTPFEAKFQKLDLAPPTPPPVGWGPVKAQLTARPPLSHPEAGPRPPEQQPTTHNPPNSRDIASLEFESTL